MSIDAQQDAISLTVLRQDGGLAASLTDFRLIAKLARSEVSEAVLRHLQSDAEQAVAGCADNGADDSRRGAAGARLCTLR